MNSHFIINDDASPVIGTNDHGERIKIFWYMKPEFFTPLKLTIDLQHEQLPALQYTASTIAAQLQKSLPVNNKRILFIGAPAQGRKQ